MDLDMTNNGTVKEYPENNTESQTQKTVVQQKIKAKEMLNEAISQWESESLEQSLIDFSLE